ncbi:MAG: 2-methylthioadenine synthetase, ribosomal protein S12 methylthiotransferase [Deltaproteobacteria bacterium CSP1-8]|nr:MAG: 2-methylthioadenine synthetase, ribosomal protein S12 methylthiotransferase [Deltaproteobacteria bacterium CSP1-8]
MTGRGKAGMTVRILTLGCAKNSVDGEVMSGLLVEDGHRVVSRGRADVGIVNTCGFIRDAKEESIGEILALAREKQRGRIRRLVVAGCLAKRYRDELPGVLPEVDLFVGPGDIPAIPGLVRKMFQGSSPRSFVGTGVLPEEAYRHRLRETGEASAFVKILEGCDHRCAYCAIPDIRGPLRSRDRDSLLAEVRMLVGRGAREINLVGQDITSYGADRGEKRGLPRLVRDICAVRGVRWVRLLYLYPGRLDDDLIDLVGTEGGKVCRYLDIPVQHIDAGVLARMGRRYGPDDVWALLERVRKRVPGVFLRTSLIVGFPGETAAAFDRLLRFVHESRWDYLGVFPYSREEGTPAHAMERQIPEAVKRERARRVRDAQADILAARNAGMAGEEIEVLVEETRGQGRAVGRHRGQAPEVDGNVLLSGYRGPVGRFCRARVSGAREWDVLAKAVDTGSPPGILT